MYLVAFAVLVAAQTSGANAPTRLRLAADCVAVPVLMSGRDALARRPERQREARQLPPRPISRCYRLSLR